MSALLWLGFFAVLLEPGDHVLLALYLLVCACGVSDLERKAKGRR